MGGGGTLLWSLSQPFFSKSQNQDLLPISDLLSQVDSWTLTHYFEDKSTTSVHQDTTIILIRGACTCLFDIWAVQNICLVFLFGCMGEALPRLSCILLHLPLCGMSIVFIKMLAFSPTKEMDVSLGDTSLLAKTRVIIFRDMYILNV